MATYTATTTGGTRNWNDPLTWTGGTTFPGSGDIVLFNQLSGPVTVTSGATCSELNFNSGTGYANTITFSNTLTVVMNASLALGNITFSAAVGFSMVGPFGITYNVNPAIASTRTLTTNNYNYNLPFTVSGQSVGSTLNLVGNLQVTNFTGSVNSFNFTGSELRVSGNWTGSAQGTNLKVLNGAGDIATLSNIQNLVIDATGFTRTFTGTIQIISSFVRNNGTISATGSTISFNGITLNLNGATLNNLSMGFGGSVVTVSTNIILTGNLLLPNGTASVNGPGTISVAGNLSNNGTTGGTCTIIMNGTGSISSGIGNPIIINSPLGTITMGASSSVNTFTLTAGTLNLANDLVLTGGNTLPASTLTITSGITIIGSGNLRITAVTTSITSNNITWPTSVILGQGVSLTTTITLNDNLTIAGSFISSSNIGATISLIGNNLYINGNLTVTKAFSGSTNISIIGAGTSTWSGAGTVGCNLDINKTAGNVIIIGTVYFGNSKTLKYTTVNGTFTTTNSILRIPSTNSSVGAPINLDLNAAGTGWNDFYVDNTVNNPTYVNLLSNASFNNYRPGIVVGSGGSSSVLNTTTSSTLSVRGDYLQGTGLGGNSKVIMVGTGSITSSAITSIDFEINSPSGIITFVSLSFGIGVGQGTRTLKYTAAGGGFITTGSTLSITFAATLDLAGTTWGSLVMVAQTNNPGIINLLGNVTFSSIQFGGVSTSNVINGAAYTVSCTGNISNTSGLIAGGDATLQLTGSSNSTWGTGSYQFNTIVNKSGVGTLVTAAAGTITWGLANRTLTFNSPVDFSNSNTFLLSGTPLTINNLSTPATQFFNMTIPAGGTLNINGATTPITGLLLCAGNATFAGTFGWTAGRFTHGGPGLICTLKAGNIYTVNGRFTMIGTALSRARLQSSDASDVTVSIPASSDQMTLVSGTIPAPTPGYVLGSRAFTTALPSVLNNLLPDRPTIASGPVGVVYTLTEPIDVTNVPSSLLLQVGKKAFFNVVNGSGSTEVIYAETRDIDSDGGITILAIQSYSDEIGQPSANLFRTLNWGPLIAPSGSVYYTFVN